MKHNVRRILAMLLALTMLFGMMPAWAVESDGNDESTTPAEVTDSVEEGEDSENPTEAPTDSAEPNEAETGSDSEEPAPADDVSEGGDAEEPAAPAEDDSGEQGEPTRNLTVPQGSGEDENLPEGQDDVSGEPMRAALDTHVHTTYPDGVTQVEALTPSRQGNGSKSYYLLTLPNTIQSDTLYYINFSQTDPIRIATKEIPSGTVLHLCLNGKTLQGNGNGAVFTVKEGGSLYLYNCASSQAEITHYQGQQTKYYGTAVLVDGGTFVAENISFSDNKTSGINYGTGLEVSSGTATLNNCTFSGNVENGVEVYGGTVTLDGVTITGNSGDGLYLSGGSTTLKDSSITGNTKCGVNLYSEPASEPIEGLKAASDLLTLEGKVVIENNSGDGQMYVGSGKTVAIGDSFDTTQSKVSIKTADEPSETQPIVPVLTGNVSEDVLNAVTFANLPEGVETKVVNGQIVLAIPLTHTHTEGGSDIEFNVVTTAAEVNALLQGDATEVNVAFDSNETDPETGDQISEFTLSETIEVPAGKTLNLCLNGKTLTAGSGLTFAILVKGTLNLLDCSEGETGVLTNPNTKSSGMKVSGTANLSAGTITGCGMDGVKVVSGQINATGTKITGNTKYGVNVYGGTFALNGSDVTGNTTADVYLEAGKVITVGDTIAQTGIKVATKTAPTEEEPVVITSGLSGNGEAATVFASANTAYEVQANDDGEAILAIPEPVVEPHKHGTTEYQHWTSADSLPTEPGNYALDVDVTVTGTAEVTGKVVLCLNGHTITGNFADPVYSVAEGGTLKIRDCQAEENGKKNIENGKGTGFSAAGTLVIDSVKLNNCELAVEATATAKVTLTNVDISNSSLGIDIASGADVTLKDVSVKGNTVGIKDAGTLKLANEVTVSGNSESNLVLAEGCDAVQAVDQSKEITGSIGITTENIPTADAPDAVVFTGVMVAADNLFVLDKEDDSIQIVKNDAGSYQIELLPHMHGDEALQPLNPNHLPDASGDYYLADDVELSDSWTIPEGVTITLCMNGHGMTTKGISVAGKLTLNDCTKTKGTRSAVEPDVLTNPDGIALTVSKPGSVELDNVNVVDSKLGIYVMGGALTMTNGAVTGNGTGIYLTSTARVSLKDVEVKSNTTGIQDIGFLTVDGNVTVSDNDVNVKLSNEKKRTITVGDDFSGSIGVTMNDYTADSMVISKGLGEKSEELFKSDSNEYRVVKKDGEAVLALPPHTHTFGELKEYETAVSTEAQLPTTSGTYYLTEDITLGNIWDIPADVEISLCLNGHTLKRTGNYAVVHVNSGATLNLYDCDNGAESTGMGTIESEGRGAVVDGTLNLYKGVFTGAANGGVYVNDGGVFNMEGGALTENVIGLVVNEGGKATMNAGVIKANSDCGVDIENGSFTLTSADAIITLNGIKNIQQNGTFTVSGDATVADEPAAEGATVVNVKLANGRVVTVDTTNGALSGKIGVTVQTPPTGANAVVVSSGAAGDISAFKSDDPAYAVSKTADGEAQLMLASLHIHEHEDGENEYFEMPISTEDELLNAGSGTYYLTTDIKLTHTLNIGNGKSIALCLNGHTLSFAGRREYGIVIDGNGASLVLCNCPDAQAGGYADAEADSDGIDVRKGRLTLIDVTVSDFGTGVNVQRDGSLTIGGETHITENTDNVVLPERKLIHLAEGMSEDSRIGVTLGYTLQANTCRLICDLVDHWEPEWTDSTVQQIFTPKNTDYVVYFGKAPAEGGNAGDYGVWLWNQNYHVHDEGTEDEEIFPDQLDNSVTEITAAGKYYLKTDLELDHTITIKNAEVVLCLNGHNLSVKNGVETAFVVSGNDSGLIIEDCTENPGKFTGNGSDVGIQIANARTLVEVIGIEVSGHGTAFVNNGSNIRLVLTDDVVTGNAVAGVNGPVTVGGTTSVYENGESGKCNIVLPANDDYAEGKTIKVADPAELKSENGIYVTATSKPTAMKAALAVSNATEALEDTFVSDQEYNVVYDDGQIWLMDLSHPHEDEDLVFKIRIDKASQMPTAEGTYYLNSELTLEDTWTVPKGDVYLCLNGKNINFTKDSSAIIVPDGSNLYLYDCSSNPDSFVGSSGNKGTGIEVQNGGKVVFNNVGVKGFDTGVKVDQGTVEFNGKVKICDNATANVYLTEGSVIHVTDGMTEDCEIGVTTEVAPTQGNPVVFTKDLDKNNTSSIINCFTSDNPDFVVRPTDDGAEAQLVYDLITVTFVSDGEEVKTTEPFKAGSPIPESEIPVVTKQGYKLEGWYTEQNEKWTMTDKVNDTMTLTAKWEEKVHVHEFTYKVDTTQIEDDTVIATCIGSEEEDECDLTNKTTSMTIMPEDGEFNDSSAEFEIVYDAKAHGYMFSNAQEFLDATGLTEDDIKVTVKRDGKAFEGDAIDVGRYEFTATIPAGTASVKIKTVLNIKPKQVDIVWTVPEGDDAIYDANNKKAVPTCPDLIAGDAVYVVVDGDSTAYKAGTYTATASLEGTKAGNYLLNPETTSKEWTIEKRPVELIWDEDTLSFVYDGEEHIPSVTLGNIVDGDTVDIEPVITKKINTCAYEGVDNYTAEVTGLTGGSASNYTLPDETTKDWVITAAELVVSGIQAEDKVYDGNLNVKFDVSNVEYGPALVEADKSKIAIKVHGWFLDKDAGADKEVKIKTITIDPECEAAKNYVLAAEGQQAKSSAEIFKRDVVVTEGIKVIDKYYNGKTDVAAFNYGDVVFSATGNNNGEPVIVEGETLTVVATGHYKDKNVKRNGDTILDKAVVIDSIAFAEDCEDAANYNLVAEGQQASATGKIYPAELTVTIKTNSSVYKRDIEELEVTREIFENHGVLLDGEGEVEAWAVGTDGEPLKKGAPVGEYETDCKCLDSNYTIVEADKQTYYITRGPGKVSDETPESVVYDGQPHTLNITVTDTLDEEVLDLVAAGEAKVYYSDSSLNGWDNFNGVSSDPSEFAQIDEGTKTVYFAVDLNPNYKDADQDGEHEFVYGTGKIVVTPKPISVSGIEAESKVYNGTAKAAVKYDNVEFVTLEERDIGKVSVTVDAAFEDKNVGEGKTVNLTNMALTGDNAHNYTLEGMEQQTTCTADITQRHISVNYVGIDTKYYDGDTKATVNVSAAQFGTVASDPKHSGVLDADKDSVMLNADTAEAEFFDADVAYNGDEVSAKPVLIKKLELVKNEVSDNYLLDLEDENTQPTGYWGIILPAEVEIEVEDASCRYLEEIPELSVKSVAIAQDDEGKDKGAILDEDALKAAIKVTADCKKGDTVRQVYIRAVMENPNYKIVSTPIDGNNAFAIFTIKRAIASISVETYNGPYDKNYHDFKVNVTAEIDGETVDLTQREYTLDGNTAKEATVYYSTEMALKGSNHKQGTTEHPSIRNVKDNPKDGVIYYYVVLNPNFTTEDNLAIADADINESVNVAGSKEFEITPISVTVSGIEANDKVYDQNNKATLNLDNVVLDGDLENDPTKLRVTFNDPQGTFSQSDAGDDLTVTFNNMRLKGTEVDNGNYVLSADSPTTATASIEKRPIAVSNITVKDGGKYYDGDDTAVLDLSKAVAGKVSGKDDSGWLSNENPDDLKFTATGTYDSKDAANGKTVTISDLAIDPSCGAANNYVIEEAQTETTGDIWQAEVKVTVGSYATPYKEELAEMTYELSIVDGKGKLVDGEAVVELETKAGKDDAGNYAPRGEYQIKAIMTDPNYKIVEEGIGTYTILRAPAMIIADTFNGVYDGKYHSAVVTVEDTREGIGALNLLKTLFNWGDQSQMEATVYYAVESDEMTGLDDTNYMTYGQVTPPKFKDAGVYTVYYCIQLDTNYMESDKDGADTSVHEYVTGKKVVTILPREVELSWGNTHFVYNGKEQVPTATVFNLVSGDKCNVTVEGAKIMPGTYTAKAVKLDNSNYVLPTKNLTTQFVIDKATQKAPAAPKVKSTTINSITIETQSGVEYSIDNGKTWQKSGTFKNLKQNTKYSIIARRPETATHYASPTSKATTVNTQKHNNASLLNSRLKLTVKDGKATVEWGNVPAATGYDVYIVPCGKDFGSKPVATMKAGTTSLSVAKLSGKNIDQTKAYKAIVVAKSGNSVLCKSMDVHSAGSKSASYTNAKSVSVASTNVTLKKGATYTVKPTQTLENAKKKPLSAAHAAMFRYQSSNTSVIKVDANGKITAVGKGTGIVLVFTKNMCAKKIAVTVN